MKNYNIDFVWRKIFRVIEGATEDDTKKKFVEKTSV